MKEAHSILIIDDHPMIIKGLTSGLLSFGDKKITVDSANDCESAVYKFENQGLNPAYDLVILDISIPSDKKTGLNSGEDLGVWIKKNYPNTKIIVLTAFNDNIRINNIYKNVNPEGFLIKTEASPQDILIAVNSVLEGKVFYSKLVSQAILKKNSDPFTLDAIDISILKEISNGTKAINLSKYIPMTKSGIEKRKRKLKELFNTIDGSDRDLIIAAREKGYI